ncbi:calcium-binding protein [Pseudooceanicola sp. C21-150M6]|uniref:calcium-binding protein n=1 Tax=Pseudooceanicola sp. C21-150M6 TaxID=3434355 RepID=UPI003D7F8C05
MRIRVFNDVVDQVNLFGLMADLHDIFYDLDVTSISPTRLVGTSDETDTRVVMIGNGIDIDNTPGGTVRRINVFDDETNRLLAVVDWANISVSAVIEAIDIVENANFNDNNPDDETALWSVIWAQGVNYVSPGFNAESQFTGEGQYVDSIQTVLPFAVNTFYNVTLSNFDERLTLGLRADNVRALGGIDELFGLAGNDTLNGGAGDDWLWGQFGNDRLVGSWGSDYIDGGFGNDTLVGGTHADTIKGGNGNDFLNAQYGNDNLDGQAGNDTLYGGANDDYLYGGWGNDVGYGGIGNDNMYGGPGNDRLHGEAGHDVVDGAFGNDLLTGGWGNDTLYGGVGHDTINGGFGNDVIWDGVFGEDIYGPSADVINAGAGNDEIRLASGYDVVTTGAGQDTVTVYHDPQSNANDRHQHVRITDLSEADTLIISLNLSTDFEDAYIDAGWDPATTDTWWQDFFYTVTDENGPTAIFDSDRLTVVIEGRVATEAFFEELFPFYVY